MKISCRNICKIFGTPLQGEFETPDPSLSKEEFQATTGQFIAVRDVSFDVHEGESFVIMGLSGSGKSTLVRCISRLIEPTLGQVIIDGDDVTAMTPAELRYLRRHKMSMVFQHFGLFPHRKIIDNIAYGLEIQGIGKSERRKKAEEILELVGLTGWGSNYPNELSGGMQQRVGIARALAVDPEILLFDEPFSALDPLIRRGMQDELIQLRKVVQKTMVFITHDFMEAIKLADSMAIMRDGEFVQVGKPEDLVLHPVDEYVREFTSDVPSQKVVTAASIAKPCEVVVTAREEVAALASALEARNVATAFVNDEEGRYLGTISAEAVNGARDRMPTQVRAYVQDHFPPLRPDIKLEELIPITAHDDVPIPVVDEDKHLLGFVDRTAVMMALAGKEPIK